MEEKFFPRSSDGVVQVPLLFLVTKDAFGRGLVEWGVADAN